MSLNLPTHPTRRHPLTGRPLQAIGLRPDGSPLYPILGGAPDPEPDDQQPERPADIPETDWDALGDPGKRVIVREREARQAAERALAASRAKPAPPKAKEAEKPPAEPTKPDEKSKSGEVDIEAIVTKAVEAATKPFREAEERRATEAAADKIRDAVHEAAKPLLHDPTDALTNIELAGVVNDQGVADPEKVKAALDDLVKRKPHLAKSQVRMAPPGIGGGAPAGATDAEKVKAALNTMQSATGVRLPAAPAAS